MKRLNEAESKKIFLIAKEIESIAEGFVISKKDFYPNDIIRLDKQAQIERLKGRAKAILDFCDNVQMNEDFNLNVPGQAIGEG